jgi:hypothetical protein
MNLEQSLLLNSYVLRAFAAGSLEELANELAGVDEGPDADGRSFFAKRLLNGPHRHEDPDAFELYDAHIMGAEARLAQARGRFSFKYFQYLALMFSEIYLDALTSQPEALAASLNAFKASDANFAHMADYTPADLRRLAYFMATGSGKTLVMHAVLWQVQHYLGSGARPDALVTRTDGRREFDSIILVTPNEGLSRQHLTEFRASGIDADLLVDSRISPGLLRPTVQVVEIHKLRLPDERLGEGMSIPVDELGSSNLVLVDEGHKGTGSEAQNWKTKQRRLASDGMLVEYSATFAQAIAAARQRDRRALVDDYGRSILFDYSYGHFYSDGFGKAFSVLNLRRGQAERAEDLLVGGLLGFYQQVRLFDQHRAALREYNLEPPLWVFLGSSVQAEKSEQGRSDVGLVLAFLHRLLTDRQWAIAVIDQLLAGKSGFVDSVGNDLFTGRLTHIAGLSPDDVYDDLCSRVFHGHGELQIVELKDADGELALRVSGPGGGESPYFGLVNIGDVPSLRRHLVDRLGLDVREDRFTDSLFTTLDQPGSRLNVLIGSRKFIEGWSSWRVAGMGLLNLGRGEGPQVIQLFGRGVRLKGHNWSLKRSSDAAGIHGEDQPLGLRELETLNVFGWNADYVQRFLETLDAEGLPTDIRVPIQISVDDWQRLPLLRTRDGYSSDVETWTLDEDGPVVERDHRPRVTEVIGDDRRSAVVGDPVLLDFADPSVLDLIDQQRAYLELLRYKQRRAYHNVLIRPSAIRPILNRCELTVSAEDAARRDRVQAVGTEALRAYLDAWVRRRRRRSEYAQLEPSDLGAVRENVIDEYVVRVRSPELRREIEALVTDRDRLLQTSDEILPRLRLDWHVYNPVLKAPGKAQPGLSVRPPALVASEQRLVSALYEFWEQRHEEEAYAGVRLFLLRNLSNRGLRFFPRAGFSPDFILWVERPTGVLVQFLEPHGLHDEGLAGNADRFQALADLERKSDEPEFRDAKVRLSGYVLTSTRPADIGDARDRTRQELMDAYPYLVWMDLPEFARKLLEPVRQTEGKPTDA